MKHAKKIAAAGAVVAALALAGCSTQADTVSYNLSQDAEKFEIERRIVFINGITDKYLLEIEGKCNIETGDSMAAGTLEVVCKVGDEEYKKHFLGLSDNVTFIVEQVEGTEVDPFHYRVNFRPETILPDIDLQVSDG
ncbi:hypothetical protein [Microbacterium jejuense]|uniref:beta-sandwich lipoprotein n=1 Tax=Microbacterium jejuense TaxID=1263637 RepID=UPI0031EA5AA9